MKPRSKDRLLGSLVLSLMALFAVSFGGYLLYEKVYLSILTGQTHERAGIVVFAHEPGGFCAWVVTYGLAGLFIVMAGIWAAYGTVKYFLKR